MSFASELKTWSGQGYSAMPSHPGYVSPAFGNAGAANAYWGQVLTNMGAPVTQSNIDFLNSWSSLEGTQASFNPLATTQGPGKGTFNSVGVQNFDSAAQGAQYTAATITNGHYPTIAAMLMSGDASNSGASSAIADAPLVDGVTGLPVTNAVGDVVSTAGDVLKSGTGQNVNVGLQSSTTTSIQGWITEIATGVWKSLWGTVSSTLLDIQNWFVRGFAIIVGLVILAIALLKLTGTDKVVIEYAKTAATAAMAA